MTDPLLSVRSMATGYGDLRVVHDVSFHVSSGQVTALLGRNGSGKTTSLRAVAGVNALRNGVIEYDGVTLTGVPAHKRVGAGISLVQEGKRLFHRQSVEENLIVGGYARGMRRTHLAAQCGEMYDLFPMLGEKRHHRAGSLSGGQQQMVAIGQALMARPRLLMLDEPSGGLAPAIVKGVMSTVAALKGTGLAILLVEQAVDAALEVADHVTVLDLGRVTFDSPVSEISDMEALRDAALGHTPTGVV